MGTDINVPKDRLSVPQGKDIYSVKWTSFKSEKKKKIVWITNSSHRGTDTNDPYRNQI